MARVKLRTLLALLLYGPDWQRVRRLAAVAVLWGLVLGVMLAPFVCAFFVGRWSG